MKQTGSNAYAFSRFVSSKISAIPGPPLFKLMFLISTGVYSSALFFFTDNGIADVSTRQIPEAITSTAKAAIIPASSALAAVIPVCIYHPP